MKITHILLIALLWPGLLHAGEADGRWALCRSSEEIIPLPELGTADDPALQISARQGSSEQAGTHHFVGDVVILHAGRRIEAGEADYDQNADRLSLRDKIGLYTGELAIHAQHGSFYPASSQGELHELDYLLRQAHASGSARQLTLYDASHARLQDASYTSCDPDQISWQLKSRRLDLDQDSNTGEARHVTLEIGDVPVLYLPYLNFPLYGRKTGLLFPTLGNSDKTGTDIRMPWYWNIAPNYDATLTPRYMSERGTQLQGEFRYLHTRNSGQINAEFLPGDDRYNNRSRHSVSYRHRGNLGHGWNSSLLYNDVSDRNYFNDLGNSLSDSSTTHLERRFDLSYRQAHWNFLGRVRDYQTLSGSQPYRILPQLVLNAASPRQLNTLQYGLTAEFVHFDHKDRQHITGSRLDLEPEVSLPLSGAAWFLTPRMALRHTRYQLQGQPGDRSPVRSQPILSLDGGLFFERGLNLAGRDLLHTLEPRLFYLYTPYREQDSLPLFDTREYNFSFAQLFRTNRYTGADRQADANQLTLALTSRLLDDRTGNELLHGSIGQIHYFKDRRTRLSVAPEQDYHRSDLVAELGAGPLPGLDLSLTSLWNPQQSRTRQLNGRMRYAPDQRHLLSLDYRYLRGNNETLRQTDLIAYWPLSHHWRALARWNYDLEQKRDLETVAGLAWEDCCRAVHIVLRKQYDASRKKSGNSILLAFELKGLSSLGKRLEDELNDFRDRR